jgi:hypothetical protein
MTSSKWQFFISKRHRRIRGLWQTFFAGWGLLFTLILVASPFVFRNMAWSILETIDLDSMKKNNMAIQNLNMKGTDRNGRPFSLTTRSAFQRFSEPNVLYFEAPVVNTARVKNGGAVVRDNISAQMGKFYKDKSLVVLSDDVRVISSDGTSARANEMEIELK